MTDEKFTFVEDVREKKRIATGAYHKRTHCGKGGAVKFPSDYMTKKERDQMNGEVKSYRLNEPMTWAEFKRMPDDIQITYIKALRAKYGVSDTKIFEMMGVSQAVGQRVVANLGIGLGKGSNRCRNWDKDNWIAWVNGVPKKETAEVALDEPKEMEAAVDAEGERYEEPKWEPPTMFAPWCGTMKFEGSAVQALATVGLMLGERNVQLTVTWEEVRDEC